MLNAVSVVIPLYNEEPNIRPVYDELTATLNTHHLDYELIFVNDGSTDNSAAVLSDLQTADKRVNAISLAQNCGQGYAVFNGIKRARKPYIAFIDCDMQTNPADIPFMLALCEKYDVVFGWRSKREDSVFKKLSSKAGNTLIRLIFGVEVKDAGCSLKVGRTKDFLSIPYFKNYHRYISLILMKKGCSFIDVETHHRPRNAGSSKHSFFKFVRVVSEWWFLKNNYLPKILKKQPLT